MSFNIHLKKISVVHSDWMNRSYLNPMGWYTSWVSFLVQWDTSPSSHPDLDFTMTHVRYGCSIEHTTGQLTHTRRSDGGPEPDGTLQKVVRDCRDNIRYYRQIYLDGPDPIAFMSITVEDL